jgi:hypothetical protein
MGYIVAHHSIAKIGFLVSQNIKCSFYKWQTLGAYTSVNFGGFVYVNVYSLRLRGAGQSPAPRSPREGLQRLLFCCPAATKKFERKARRRALRGDTPK